MIFFEAESYSFFIRQLRRYLMDQGTDIVAYCLMPNHFHLLLKLSNDELSAQMHDLIVSYTKAINKRFARSGALFQGKFQAIVVERDEYLLHLSRYIHLNPVKAALTARPEDWAFSSYREYLGLRSGTLPKPDLVMAQFPSRDDYKRFVEYDGPSAVDVSHLMLD